MKLNQLIKKQAIIMVLGGLNNTYFSVFFRPSPHPKSLS
jgi:hypothetical protein